MNYGLYDETNPDFDVLLVICGCVVRCVDYKKMAPKGNYMVVGGANDFDMVKNQLEKILKEQKT